MENPKILWNPSREFIEQSEFLKFQKFIENKYSIEFQDYVQFRKWSVKNYQEFWKELFRYFKIIHDGSADIVISNDSMPYQKWFPKVRLNYAENILEREKIADFPIYGYNENGFQSKISSYMLKGSVGALGKYLKDKGVQPGDRIASILPNIPEAIIASLATSSIGAIWSSSSPDFGLQGILDRFSQIEPKILFAVDSYQYNGKVFRKEEMIDKITEKIKSIKEVILVTDNKNSSTRKFTEMSDILKENKTPSYERLNFNDPLWILYSSGTTGPPKAIVHGHGNILLEHLKLLNIHYNLNYGKKFFWYTTTGWMMWNVLLSSIGTGASAIAYDGSATYPDPDSLWKLTDEIGISFFGTSAAFLTYCMKEQLDIIGKYNLKNLYAIGSTGSPLPPEAFRYVYDKVKSDVWLASISGGTDVCTAFLGGCPTRPVYEGELQCINLGADIHSYDDHGNDLINETGELVITKPYISMPVFLWNDSNYSRYIETYLSKYPGIWNHGDWIIITERETAIILGRSDSTLKRRGIRIGTAEIYRVVENIPEVKESLIIGVELEGGDYYMPLFVVTKGEVDPEKLRNKIVETIKKELSPRHIPDEIIYVKDIPKTINGKKMEVPIKKLFMGISPDKALNRSSMANPSSLDEYIEIAVNFRNKISKH